MRPLLRETLFLLLSSSGSNILVENTEISTLQVGLSYSDFEALRPDFAASSWRGILNRLVSQRYVLKRLVNDKTTFQLTRLGGEWFIKNVFSGFLAAQEDRMNLVLLKPSVGRKQTHARARRLLEERGYLNVMPGVYLSQTGTYSDLLWQSLSDCGFTSIFIRLPLDAARPIQLPEFLGSGTDQVAHQRQWTEVSKELSQLLLLAETEKELKPSHKKRIGQIIVSGLELTTQWTPFWSVEGIGKKEVVDLFRGIFQLVREFKKYN
jgi:hypothetical protein